MATSATPVPTGRLQVAREAHPGYEDVLVCRDPAAGYVGVVAIHDTTLGPAVGGTRLWRYPSLEAATADVLRLSRGMTYKSAMAGLPFGGGKAVVLAPASALDAPARAELFRAHGRFVDSLGGRYVTAEDVGTTPDDMTRVRETTPHVVGLPLTAGDPGPATAQGVFRALQAAVRHRWAREELAGLRVAVQGCGNVGAALALKLRAAGARLVLADVDPARAAAVAARTGAEVAEAEAIHAVDAHLFAPCALGGVLNDATIPQLRAEIVVGAANNQLLESRHAEELLRRDILYVPDYVANSGGIISGTRDSLGWTATEIDARIDAIHATTLQVLDWAAAWGVSPQRAADRLAEARIREARRPSA